MAKPTIVTRAGKGSALTWTEGDANLTNLQDATIGITDGTTSGTLDLNDTLTFTAGSNVTLSYNATSKALTINASSGGGVPTQVDFTATPTSTDVYFAMTSATGAGAKDLYAPSNGGLKFNTGTGQITSLTNFNTEGNIVVRLGGNVQLYDNDDSNRVTVSAPADLTSNVTFRLPNSNGTSGQVLQTDGTGVTSWATASGGATTLDGLTDVVAATPTALDILQFDGTNWIDAAPSTVTVGVATEANTVKLTADPSTNATNYLTFVNAATGSEDIRVDTGLTYNPSTNTISATTFSGNATSATTATTATTATNVNIASADGNAGDTAAYIVMTPLNATGSQALHTDGTLVYNAVTNALSVGGLIRTGAISSAAWTTAGLSFRNVANILTDTSSTGTVAANYANIFGAPSLASSNVITITDAVNLYVAAPVASTNTTITNASAILTNGVIKSTLATGTAPFVVASTTNVANLNASSLNGATFAAPGAIGSSTASTGAFTTLGSSGLTTANSLSVTTNATLKDIRETVFTLTYAATITPDVANGTVQKITLTGNVTFSAFANPVAGQTVTLIITQDATGSRTLTSTMKFSGASKTLSTAANSIDILTVFYDGSTYYASLGKGFA